MTGPDPVAGSAAPPGRPARVGLFGGSFDPVHRAHLAVARAAREQLRLDRVLWIPAGRPWQKPGVSDAAHREAMLRLALQDEPGFELERLELDRPGPSYTLDTVRALQAREPDTAWLLILGQDQFAALHTWHGWRELLARVTLAVVGRPHARAATAPEGAPEGAPKVAPEIAPEVAALARHVPVLLPPLEVSSSAVRARVAAGEPVDDLVPPAVARYVEIHGLYRRPGQATPRS